MRFLPVGPRVRLALAVGLALGVTPLACKKETATPTPAPTPAPSDPAPTPAPTTGTTTPTTDAPAGADGGAGRAIEKSDELRFIEANAALLCFEKVQGRKLKDTDRTVILKDNGFGGKDGADKFNQFSIRGSQDAEWGKRTGIRIQEEVTNTCGK